LYGIPADTDLSFLVHKVLEQVCIGQNEAILRFGDDVSITIESDMSHASSAGEVTAIYKTIAPSAPMLVSLINCSIEKASAIPPGTLRLEFSNGDRLEIHDAHSAYESYQITHGDKIIVV